MLQKKIISLFILTVATLVILLPTDILAMSKSVSFVSSIGSKVGSFFGKGTSTSSSCTNCESRYRGRKPPLGVDMPLWQYHARGATWTKLTLDAIDREGLANFNPKDAAVYCPNWNKLSKNQRRSFWLNLSTKIAEIESNFNPSETYRESNGVNSNGLFSMSKGDRCGIMKTEADTYDEKKNIDCAIKTMRMLVAKEGYIGTGNHKGLGHYWQPMIDNPKKRIDSTVRNKRNILNYTRSLPYCRLNAPSAFWSQEESPLISQFEIDNQI